MVAVRSDTKNRFFRALVLLEGTRVRGLLERFLISTACQWRSGPNRPRCHGPAAGEQQRAGRP
jgi:hypothetical protein